MTCSAWRLPLAHTRLATHAHANPLIAMRPVHAARPAALDAID